jgi:hypothetical protein
MDTIADKIGNLTDERLSWLEFTSIYSKVKSCLMGEKPEVETRDRDPLKE